MDRTRWEGWRRKDWIGRMGRKGGSEALKILGGNTCLINATRLMRLLIAITNCYYYWLSLIAISQKRRRRAPRLIWQPELGLRRDGGASSPGREPVASVRARESSRDF